MSDENKKILLLNYNSEATKKVSGIFQQYEITIAESLKDVAEKAKDDYDLIITGYVVPTVSGDMPLTYLKNIETSIKKIESAIKGKKPGAQIEKKSQEKQDQILQLLNDQIKGYEKEKGEMEVKLKNMEEEVAGARHLKEEAEKNAETALKEKQEAVEEKTKVIDKLNSHLNRLSDQLEDAKTRVQQIQIEKEKNESKLKELQENWEKYVG